MSLGVFVFNATLLMLAGLWVRKALDRQPAALRHLAWVLVFASLLILPLAAPFVIKIPVSVPTFSLPERGPSSSVTLLKHAPPGEPKALANGFDTSPIDVAPAVPKSNEDFTWLWLAAWAVGFVVVLGRSLRGLLAVRVLRDSGTQALPVPPDVDDLARSAGVRRAYDLREAITDQPPTALTWGVWNPVVLLPQSAREWTPERQEAVLLHEFAHVRRLDFLSQLMAETVCAIYWFNPLVWLGARAMREDAESAADDVVLGTGIRPSRYAEELLRIAAEIGKRRTLNLHPGIPTMNPTKIESRLQSVLAPAARRRGLTHVQILATLAVAAAALPVVASFQVGTVQVKNPITKDREDLAMQRLKQVATATIMYANDWDDLFPYVQQSASARGVITPYLKNDDVLDSPTPGGKFLFNLNIGGVKFIIIEQPAETPMWMEEIPNATSPFSVAYTDGHVKKLEGSQRSEVVRISGKRFARTPDSRPLPKIWMVKN